MVDKLKNISQYGDRNLIDDNNQSEPVFTWPILPPIVDVQENLRTQRPKSAKSVNSVVSVDSIQIKSTNHDDYSKTTKSNKKGLDSSNKEFKLPEDFTEKVEEIARMKSELDILRESLNKVI
jgi:hypothetical protein